MSSFEAKTKVIEAFWVGIFGKNPAGQCSIALSVSLLGTLYLVAMFWLVPWAVFKALRHAGDQVSA